MPWTTAQQEAIEARGCNLLVSAAAGSGKTAVLTERIVSLVKEGTRIDDLLVVTFTKAAAAEMRARITSALHEAAAMGNEALAAQALRVERADITTLHGFCTKVCRDHFQAAGVDPTFRVADGAEASVLHSQALVAALTACYEEPTPAFEMAAVCFSHELLGELVTRLHRFLIARPDPWTWLEDAVAAHDVSEETLIQSGWMDVLMDQVGAFAAIAVEAFERQVAFSRQSGLYIDVSLEDLALAQSFQAACDQGYAAVAAFGKISFARKPTKKKDVDEADEAQFGALRSAAKDALKSATGLFDKTQPLDLRTEDEQDNRWVLEGIAQATRAFAKRFAALKAEKNLLDFSDLEHFALHALAVPGVSQALQAHFAFIFVDEYQDSSLLQEALLKHICRDDNLFMVGDVKQSIYRFRLADSSLFLRKLTEYQLGEGAVNRRISLNANFRSHSVLLDGINEVFDRVFNGGSMELTYPRDARLLPGTLQEWTGAPIELHLLTDADTLLDAADEAEDAATLEDLSPAAKEAIRQEAEVIADRILALRNAPEGGYRLRDMAILMRTVRGKAAQVIEVLRARGISAWSDLGENTLTRGEVQAVLSLLQTIDNLHQDVPLLAALRGPAMRLSDDSLAAIRVAFPEGTFADALLAYAGRDDALALALRGFVERIRGWALDAQVMPLDRLIRQVLDETGHYAAVGALPEGEIRQANLRALSEYAGSYQRTQGGSLGGFLRYLERVQSGEGIAAQELGEHDDVVRVLSIHKSKGLQYPVVFVAGLGRRFSQQDAKLPIQLHSTLGAGLVHIDPALRTRRPTLSQNAILEKQRQEDLAEEARILYVAMTRAEKRLILVGSSGRQMEERWLSTSIPPERARTMLDWIAPAAFASGGWSVLAHTDRREAASAVSDVSVRQVAELVRGTAPPGGGAVHAALQWTPARVEDRPLKQSVSSVVRAEAKAGEREDSPAELDALPKRPLFMEEKGLTATERGDAVHIFFRSVPLDEVDAQSAIRYMVDRDLLSREQAHALPISKLTSALHSDLWTRMRSSPELHREWPFNLRVEQAGNRTLLQGIIDCCFLEDGEWILVDYKTDHVAGDPSPILDRYRPQLALYAQALQAITHIPVKEQLLYLLDKNIAYGL